MGVVAIIEFSIYALMALTAITAYFTIKSRI